jgi:nuclear pore complex protein Nup133
MRAASQYREKELGLYATDRENPATELWTAATGLLDALESLYNTTVRLIAERTRDLGSAVDQAPSDTDVPQLRAQRATQQLLKDQLTELAAALCTNMEDKLRATSR